MYKAKKKKKKKKNGCVNPKSCVQSIGQVGKNWVCICKFGCVKHSLQPPYPSSYGPAVLDCNLQVYQLSMLHVALKPTVS